MKLLIGVILTLLLLGQISDGIQFKRTHHRSKRQANLYGKEKTFFGENEAVSLGSTRKGKPELVEFPKSPQKIRLRGEGSMNSNEGRIEIFDDSQQKWGLVCDDYWSGTDGNVTCRELGFVNGAREASRTDRYGRGPLKDNFARHGIKCMGGESSMLNCPHEYGYCTGKSASVSCLYNSGCEYGWTSYKGACFRVYSQKLNFMAADKYCKDHDSKLVYVLDVEENNFLTNMLYNQFRDVEQIWTGGYYAEIELDNGKVDSRWKWYNTIHSIESWGLKHLWFPGFNGRSARPSGDFKRKSCIALQRIFDSKDVNYFWFENLSCNDQLPFICQKNIPKMRSDCYDGNGISYRGRISRTTQGSLCAKWTDPGATVNPQSNPNAGLGDHNFCRNPDNDQQPWCWVNPQRGLYGYCAIGKCSEITNSIVTQKPANVDPPGFGKGGCQSAEYHCPSMITYRSQCLPKPKVCDKNTDCVGKEDEDSEFCKKYLCGDNEFFCSADTFCISQSYVCDGRQQCRDGADELNCPDIGEADVLKNYEKFEGYYIEDPAKLVYYQVSLTECMQKCKNLYPQFKCRGFNHLGATNIRSYTECQLLTVNKYDNKTLQSLNGKPGGHYAVKTDCSGKFQCSNGQCVDTNMKCNGKNDCGDNSDELGCPAIVFPPFEIRLTGSPNKYEGKVEVKYQGEWGYICDDNFGLPTASVICKQLGFAGALEAVSTSVNRFGKVRDPIILLDELVCKGDEPELVNCSHNPWRQHDCRVDELAGVVCKVDRACTDTEFRCKSEKICIPLVKVCDGTPDCADKSDEPQGKCQLTVSLVGGSDSKSGRVELSKGYSRGTICDDGFDDNEAQVICRILGISGRGEAVHDKRFGPGQGIIALNNMNCRGDEDRLEKCSGYRWGGHNCDHKEDVGVVCGLPPKTVTEAPSVVTTLKTSPVDPNRKCGNRPIVQGRSRVVGGFETLQGAFPWQVGVRQKAYDYDYHHCGATVVSEDWIISAAHCYTRPKNEYRVRTGDWDNTVDEKYEQAFEIEQLIIHPQWDSSTYDYDLALIKVSRINGEGIKFNNFVQPVCLPEPDMVPDPNTKCYVSGWGDTLSEYPEKLLAAEVPLLSRTRCDGMYKGRLTDRMQCAGYEAGGIDTCQGDSGGPLICKVQGVYTQFGATSWGNGCAQPRSPGVYANLRFKELRDFIKQMTGL